MLSGLFLAMLGREALLISAGDLFLRKHFSAEFVFASLFFFAVLSVGLRWMLVGWIRLGYWGNVGTLFAGFALLPEVVWQFVGLIPSFALRHSPYFLLSMLPSAIATFCVSLRMGKHPATQAQEVGWITVGWGVITTALVAVGTHQGQLALDQARLAADRAAMAAYPKIPSNLPYPKLFFQKGVNLSAEGPDGYASESAREMVELLPKYGVNTVALVPYGFGRRNSVQIMIGGSLETDEGLEELSRVAHARGVKVMLKPGMWVEGGYAGDLEFSSAEDRAKWFARYRLFLEHYARLAAQIHADIFCVGGEFVKLTRYEREWRNLIARARELYPGPLVYAANFGQEFESITFWDALDYIGLQEYYPLPDDLSTDSLVQRVEIVQKEFQQPVIFTEAGFPNREGANREPWDDAGGKVSPELQARCYEAIFGAFYAKPWFQGIYWWKVGSNGHGGPEDSSHTPWGKPAMKIISRHYLSGER